MSYIPDAIFLALKRIKDTSHKLIWDKYGMTPLASRQDELLDIVFEAISKEFLAQTNEDNSQVFGEVPKYSDYIWEDNDV